MASTQVTDEELFSELKRFGYTPGPLTESTRPVYLKKLKKFREEQQQRGSRSCKTRSSGVRNSNTGGGNSIGSRPVSHDVAYLNSGRRPGRKSSVLSFSSDESDAETKLKRKGPNHNDWVDGSSSLNLQTKLRSVITSASKSQHGVTSALNSNSSRDLEGQKSISSQGIHARSSLDGKGTVCDGSKDDDNHEGGIEKNSCSFNGCGASHLNISRLAGDYSDTDEEEVGGLDRQRDMLLSRLSYQALLPSHAVGRGSQTKGTDREVNPPESQNMVESRRREEGEDEIKRRKPGLSGNSRGLNLTKKSINVSLTGKYGEAGKNNHVSESHGASKSSNISSFNIGVRPRFSNYMSLSQTYGRNNSIHTAANHKYSQGVPKQKATVPEDELLQQFKREEVVSSASFSAHYLSMFLLTAACGFFLLLGLMYLRMRGSGSPEVDGVSKYLARYGSEEIHCLSPLIVKCVH